ncbi:acyl-CoA dehydrogenase family protein [Ancylobacter sp. Lp-2]|uniref:acyl-CoA dehydrogenase family protein n=1 Tax=Ancylobacter sp. Lp-2 TaxID=2881339 RepID=UPI001E608E56|nr:acyl-CoA dehydrogenase family protein [Ancylobacter sp. Lp-2]MCB4770446.1 acyl-CoA dehydrogenase family protein [Ancylobacter sp. Lp-2]
MTAHIGIPQKSAAFLSSHEEAVAAACELAAGWKQVAASIDAERRVPQAELDALGRSGLLAITIPSQHGGPGLGAETLIEVFLILGAADTALAQVPQNHFDFVDTLLVAAPQTQKLLYGDVLAGARFGNAIAEPNRRSRADLKTAIVEDGDGYLINGAKYFSTGALTAQWVPVHALHADGRVRTAYVANGTPGLELRKDWDAFGQRATFSGTTLLTNVRVPASQVVDRSLGDPGLLTAQFAGNQLIHAAIEAGSAIGALSTAARWLGEAETPSAVRLARLGDLRAEAEAATALVRRAARLVDAALERPLPPQEAPLAAAIAVDEAKSLAYELGPQVASELLDFSPPGAVAERLRLDRFWRNTRTHSMHDPVRWRQAFVGDYHLNGRLSADLQAKLKLAAPIIPNKASDA